VMASIFGLVAPGGLSAGRDCSNASRSSMGGMAAEQGERAALFC
jgi:hypothetical protein